MSATWTVVVGLMLGGAPGASGAEPAPRAAPQTAQQLFQPTTVWNIHLTFTPEQWARLEPEPIDRPKGAALPGPGQLFLPAILGAGDTDRSGSLSRAEFQALAERWYGAWDTEKTGALGAKQVRDGLNTALDFEALPRPPADADAPRQDDIAAALGVRFRYAHADVELEGRVFKDVGVRYKGNFTYSQSRDQLKRSLKLDLDRFVPEQNLGGLRKLNLHSNVADSSWMNEPLSFRLYRDAGVAAPRTAYAHVTLTVPGQYDRQEVGLFSLVENVDKAFERMNFQSDAGALFKPAMTDLFTDLGDDWKAYDRSYYPKDEVSAKQRARLIAFSKLVSHASDKEFAARLEQFLDLEAFCRYLAVTTYLATMDSFLLTGHNFDVHLDARAQKFRFVPWDLDNSFGQFGLIDNERLERLSIEHPWQGHKRFLERFFQVPAFKARYLARMKQLHRDVFSAARVSALVDESAAVLRPYVARESAEKLTRFDQLAAGETIPAPRFKGMGLGDGAAGMDLLVRPIKPFAQARSRSITEQLEGKSPGEVLQVSPIGLGMFYGQSFLNALDTNHDGQVSRDEFTGTFARWFDTWDEKKTGVVSVPQLQAGLERALKPAAAGDKP